MGKLEYSESTDPFESYGHLQARIDIKPGTYWKKKELRNCGSVEAGEEDLFVGGYELISDDQDLGLIVEVSMGIYTGKDEWLSVAYKDDSASLSVFGGHVEGVRGQHEKIWDNADILKYLPDVFQERLGEVYARKTGVVMDKVYKGQAEFYEGMGLQEEADQAKRFGIFLAILEADLRKERDKE